MPQFIEVEIGPRALRTAYDQTGLPVGVMELEDAYIPEVALAGFISAAARCAGDRVGLRSSLRGEYRARQEGWYRVPSP